MSEENFEDLAEKVKNFPAWIIIIIIVGLIIGLKVYFMKKGEKE